MNTSPPAQAEASEIVCAFPDCEFDWVGCNGCPEYEVLKAQWLEDHPDEDDAP